MALSAPSTPRSNFTTPKRLNQRPQETPDCFSQVTLETPSSAAKCRSMRASKDKFDEVSNLTVAVRIRPMNNRELSVIGATNAVKVKDQDLVVRAGTLGAGYTNIDHIFHYDHIFWSVDEESPAYASQADVFRKLGQPLLDSAFRGYNACLFAYGQTGSGKSYSMMGQNSLDTIDIDSESHSGVTPRFCRELFTRIAELDPDTSVSVEVSYFEIYNEKIHDLLAASTNRMPLKVREHPEWGPHVVNLSVHVVKSYEELRQWLLIGNKNRATAATAMNEKSSRSHSIFSIELCLSDGVEQMDSSRRSKVSLVDLAGSERLGSTHNTEEKIRQGVSINKSLLTLGKVISALAEQKKNQFVPYRESVLTWLLRESLGGNSLTSMLATITPANSHVDETLATLRYACQARSIVNRARVNENPHDKLIRELRAEVERLRALRQDYRRNSQNSIIILDDSANRSQELEDLRDKLSQTEQMLEEAQRNWEQRFMETKRHQLEELAEVEKRKEELESHVRVLETLNTSINLSPIRTNFLEAVDGVLSENVSTMYDFTQLEQLCARANLNFSFTLNDDTTVTITNCSTQKTACCSVTRLDDLCTIRDVMEFNRKLIWMDAKKNRKLSKSEVNASMKQIYSALANLQPFLEEEDRLRLLFAKVNKSVQSLETALMNCVCKANAHRTVTFNV